MSTALRGAKAAVEELDHGDSMPQWYDSKYYKIGLLAMLAVAIFWIWYQRTYATHTAWIQWSPSSKKSGWVCGAPTCW